MSMVSVLTSYSVSGIWVGAAGKIRAQPHRATFVRSQPTREIARAISQIPTDCRQRCPGVTVTKVICTNLVRTRSRFGRLFLSHAAGKRMIGALVAVEVEL